MPYIKNFYQSTIKMHRRNAKKYPNEHDDPIFHEAKMVKDRFFSEAFRDVYGNMEKNNDLPSILNFGFDNTYNKKNVSPATLNHNLNSGQTAFSKQSDKKLGIKNLLKTKSKVTYPFQDIPISTIVSEQTDKKPLTTETKPTTIETKPVESYRERMEKEIEKLLDDSGMLTKPVESNSNDVVIDIDAITVGKPVEPETIAVEKPVEPETIAIEKPVEPETIAVEKPVDVVLEQQPISLVTEFPSNYQWDNKTESVIEIPQEKIVTMNPEEQEIQLPEEIAKVYRKNIIPISELISQVSEQSIEVPEIPEEKESNQITKEQIMEISQEEKPVEVISNNLVKVTVNKPNKSLSEIIYNKHLSDKNNIENKLNDPNCVKKIDIKNDDNNNIVVSMESKQVSNPIMNKQVEVSKITTITTDTPQTETPKPVEQTNIVIVPSEPVKSEPWPVLSVDNINTTFKVVADLPANTKLKVVGRIHLAAEDSYIPSFSRYQSEQGREIIISFLEHVFKETDRNLHDLLRQINNGESVDNNISVLSNMMYKLSIFLHRYDNMRNVYKNDSGVHARLGNIRDNFFTFYNNMFRELTAPKTD